MHRQDGMDERCSTVVVKSRLFIIAEQAADRGRMLEEDVVVVHGEGATLLL